MIITDAKLLFRLKTLTIKSSEGNIQHLPFNFLQKQANNDSKICSFEILDDSKIKLYFENHQNFIFSSEDF